LQGRVDTERAAAAGMLCAAAMIAQQVGAKAARDALFLSSFPVTALPSMLVASAVVSVFFVVLTSRALAARGPGRLLPLAFGASALLCLVEWVLAPRFPRGVAVAVYLHVASFGSVLISAFWLLASERFDPRTARRMMGRIGAAGTLGGLLGGLLAAALAAFSDVTSVLLLLGVLNLLSAWMAQRLRPKTEAARTGKTAVAGTGDDSPWGSLIRVPYLRAVAGLVVLGSVAATLADYLFKVHAVAAHPEAAGLMRFFAAFYAVAGVLTLGVQVLLSRASLERLGLSGTVATLPVAVVAGGLLSAAAPGLLATGALRAAEAVLRGSLHRVGYELLYTPLPVAQKRATKTLVDVGVDRLGDVLGGLFIRVVLLLAPGVAVRSLSLTVAGLGLVGVWLARELRRGYIEALEKSLLTRAVAIDPSEVLDSTTRATVLRTGTGLVRPETQRPFSPPVLGAADPLETGFVLSLSGPRKGEEAGESAARPSTAVSADPLVGRLHRLRSGRLETVRQALAEESPLDPLLVPQALRLLAWDEVCDDAVRALRRAAPRATGQLLDVLLDQEQEFAVRRRIPRVLVAGDPQRAMPGLLQGLHDTRFEVRFQCGLALARLQERAPDTAVPEAAVVEAVLRESAAGRAVWESRRLLDEGREAKDSPHVEDFVRTRSNRSLEHVFTLLSLVLPRQPLRVAFHALHTDDAHHRGTALEYLDTVLPDAVRQCLWPFLTDERPRAAPARPREDALRDLLRSSESIELRLAELRGGESESK
jgi:ATP:ADP antiporter, AAA family